MASPPNSIITPQAPKSNAVTQAFTANTTYTTLPTNTALIVTAGPNGSRMTKMRALPTATVTASQLQEFRSSDTGTTKHFSNAVLGASAGYTMGGTTAPPIADFGYSDDNPKFLAAGEQLYVAVGVSGSWSFEAEWQDY